MSLGLGGFTIKRLADIKLEIEASAENVWGVGNVDPDPSGPMQQWIGILADREASWQELVEIVVLSLSETGASGTLLDQLYVLHNLVRLTAAPSRTIASDGVTATTTLTGTPGTIVPAGFALDTSDTAARFLLEDPVTIGLGGTVLGIFASEGFGAIPALAGTLTVIPIALTGLTSATNGQDARLGRLEETDAEFRARRARGASVVAASTVPSVTAAILGLPDVVEVRAIVNRADTPDLDGRPGHSYELVVRGGADQSILDAVFITQPAGIQTVGTVDGFSIDQEGDAQPVSFSRPTIVPVYITVDLTVDGAFPASGVTDIANAILTYGQTQLREGLTVSPFKIEQGIETPGVVVFDMKIGLSANPTSSSPLAIAQTAIAEFDSTRLVVRRIN